jgi:hypothetical protein
MLGVPEHPWNFGIQKREQSLISAYRSLAITTNTPGFKKLSLALQLESKKEKLAKCSVHLYSSP